MAAYNEESVVIVFETFLQNEFSKNQLTKRIHIPLEYDTKLEVCKVNVII
jgi:hypothetical protein